MAVSQRSALTHNLLSNICIELSQIQYSLQTSQMKHLCARIQKFCPASAFDTRLIFILSLLYIISFIFIKFLIVHDIFMI